MTRKEARGNLIYAIRWNDMPEKEALEKAIEALEQEPCADAISRQAAIEQSIVLRDISNPDKEWEVVTVATIKHLKSVNTAEKVGHNEPMQVELEGDGYADGQIVYDWGKCPNCGWEFENGDKDWEEPYCCHCGQKLHWFENEGGDAE